MGKNEHNTTGNDAEKEKCNEMPPGSEWAVELGFNADLMKQFYKGEFTPYEALEKVKDECEDFRSFIALNAIRMMPFSNRVWFYLLTGKELSDNLKDNVIALRGSCIHEKLSSYMDKVISSMEPNHE